MDTANSVYTKTEAYFPIDLRSLRLDSVLEFPLYMKVEGEYVLYRAPSMPFTPKTRDNLIANGVRALYVSADDQKAYQKYIEVHLVDIMNDESIDQAAKSNIIYDSARMIVHDLMKNPSLPENLQRGLSLVESTAMFLIKNQDAFYSLLQTMSFDYSTYSHSVNVSIFALALGNRVGITDRVKQFHLGTGALLHDIGKSKIPSAILDKNGPLTDIEMALVRRHPHFGFEIVLNSGIIPHDAHYPILQHHERENGTGYPYGLHGPDIHRYSKITAIADVFDAMTTKRAYRGAKEAFSALSEIYDDADAFDGDLLREFTQLLGPKAN